MKKCVLLFLSLFAVVPAFGQEAGNRIYGNTGYYQQKRQMLPNVGQLGNSGEGYAIEARVLRYRIILVDLQRERRGLQRAAAALHDG